jgi:hypothetical protein
MFFDRCNWFNVEFKFRVGYFSGEFNRSIEAIGGENSKEFLE